MVIRVFASNEQQEKILFTRVHFFVDDKKESALISC